MISISPNKIIRLVRGDTFEISLTDLYDTNKIELGPDDNLYFALMEPNQSFENAIVKKVFGQQSPKDANGNLIINFDSTDTEYLSPGKYYYMIKLRTIKNNKEFVDTLILPTLFWVEGGLNIDCSDI